MRSGDVFLTNRRVGRVFRPAERADQMNPRFIVRVGLIVVAVVSPIFSQAAAARADNIVSIVPGTFTQGTVKPSLLGGTYASESNNMSDWPLTTSGTPTKTYPIGLLNPNYNNPNNPNTLIAFGNGGGVTLQFDTPLLPAVGRKDLGIFTAQSINSSDGSLFNGNMEAAILVSADNASWYTLTGLLLASPTTYTTTAYSLNTPTMAYHFGTSATAWTYGLGTPVENLNALTVADFTVPMPDDNLFNGTGTNAERLALKNNNSLSNYAAIFGNSGGGNWFDVSGSGLAQISYVRLNGTPNVPATGGVRLDAVFANVAAVPEPSSLLLLTLGAGALIKPRRRIRVSGSPAMASR